MTYFTIVTRENATQAWAPQFGDHDREVVKQEVEDAYVREYGRKNVKIVASKTSHRYSVDAAIATLNGDDIPMSDILPR